MLEEEKLEAKVLNVKIQELQTSVTELRRQLSDLIDENSQRMRENARKLIRRSSMQSIRGVARTLSGSN